MTKPCPPASVVWHPSKKILAVGWENGDLTLWSEDGNQQLQLNSALQGAISVLQWNASGSRIVSGDNVSVF